MRFFERRAHPGEPRGKILLQLWRLTVGDPGPVTVIQGNYDPALVAISLLIACSTGFAAFAVLDRLQEARTARIRTTWIAAGMVTMGCGIWAIHFSAMMAFRMPGEVRYDLLLTVLSAVPPMLCSGLAFRYLFEPKLSRGRLQAAAFLVATGIGTMHYLGMEAMHMTAELRYDALVFGLSIAVAHLSCTIALWLAADPRNRVGVRRIWAAAAIGLAVAGTHFTAMAAARFYASPSPVRPSGYLLEPWDMGVVILVISLLITALAVVASRVTRQYEQTKDRLEGAEAREQSILDAMADGLILTDENARIESVNLAAEKTFGYRSGELKGRPLDELMIPQARRDDASRRMIRGLAKGTMSQVEGLGRRKDGSEFPVEASMSAFNWRGQRRFTTIVRDVTERYAIESQVRHAQKLESIGQFAAGIAREVNAPIEVIDDNTAFLQVAFSSLLRAVDHSAALLEEADAGEIRSTTIKQAKDAVQEANLDFLRSQAPQALEQTRASVSRVGELISALTEFSHPSQGRKQPVDLNRAIDAALTVARSEWRSVAEVATNFDAALPGVLCMRDEISQVLLTVIAQAARSIARANGEARDTKGKITIQTRQAERWAEIRVSDTGVGLPAETRKRAFDPSLETPAIDKAARQALAAARAVVVEKHQGEMTIEPAKDRGDTFVIRLPLGEHVMDAPNGAETERALI